MAVQRRNREHTQQNIVERQSGLYRATQDRLVQDRKKVMQIWNPHETNHLKGFDACPILDRSQFKAAMAPKHQGVLRSLARPNLSSKLRKRPWDWNSVHRSSIIQKEAKISELALCFRSNMGVHSASQLGKTPMYVLWIVKHSTDRSGGFTGTTLLERKMYATKK